MNSLYTALTEFQRTTEQPANIASVAVIGHVMERARHFHAQGHAEPFGIVEAIHCEAERDKNTPLREFLYSAETTVCRLVARVMDDADADAKQTPTPVPSPPEWACLHEIVSPSERRQTARQVLREQMEARRRWAA